MKKLKMQIFGTFSLTDGNVTLGEEELHLKKLIRLLVYIIMHRDSMVSHQKLIEVFWENNSKNPAGALRNQIYLLRNALKVFGEEELIMTAAGAYQWNPEVQVETDYEQLEEMIQKLQDDNIETEEKQEICQKIISYYGKDIAEPIADDIWILSKKTYYQAAYLDTIRYERTIFESGNSIAAVKNFLDEEVCDSKQKGAYFCDFEVFRGLYQLESRRVERLGIAEYIILFTLVRKWKKEKTDAADLILQEGILALEKIVKSSLRNSDVATRYGETQVIVLLPVCTYESSIKVAERIRSNFYNLRKRRSLDIDYEIAEITAVI